MFTLEVDDRVPVDPEATDWLKSAMDGVLLSESEPTTAMPEGVESVALGSPSAKKPSNIPACDMVMAPAMVGLADVLNAPIVSNAARRSVMIIPLSGASPPASLLKV